jgi:hypothetical protein
VRCPVRVTPGQASIAATNLQYAAIGEIRHSEQGAGFVIFGVYSDRHVSFSKAILTFLTPSLAPSAEN